MILVNFLIIYYLTLINYILIIINIINYINSTCSIKFSYKRICSNIDILNFFING